MPYLTRPESITSNSSYQHNISLFYKALIEYKWVYGSLFISCTLKYMENDCDIFLQHQPEYELAFIANANIPSGFLIYL